MENGPFEDVFPIENGDFPWLMLVYQRVSQRFFTTFLFGDVFIPAMCLFQHLSR